MADEPATAPSGPLLGPARNMALRLVRAANVTLGTDPSMGELYRTRFEGAPPKVRVRDGVVTVEYRPRILPDTWGGHAAEVVLSPAAGWRIEVPRGVERLRADLAGVRLLGLEVAHAAANAELTLARPAGPVVLRFDGGARDVTIHRPVGTAARVSSFMSPIVWKTIR